MDAIGIEARVKRIRERIDEAARVAGCGRVRLLAASKTRTADEIRGAIRAGVDLLGENRVQEMCAKIEQHAYEGAPLHFIGHLQKNKVKLVVGAVAMIESVGSAELAAAIDSRAVALDIVQDVLLEINIGCEASKSGFLPGEFKRALNQIAEMKRLRVRGLMAIPPASASDEESRRYFAQMRQLFVDTGAEKYDNIFMETLSMGMSGDYLAAIAGGANQVRIGSAIFGERIY